MYNMQSGISRRTFDIGPCPANVPSRFRPAAGKKREERCITGLASDALDRTVVASTLDGTINVSHLLPFTRYMTSNCIGLSSSSTSIQRSWNMRLSFPPPQYRSYYIATVACLQSYVTTSSYAWSTLRPDGLFESLGASVAAFWT